ncbi:MAG: TerB family tellurite resistance protein [Leptospiraceae bacterium]|nr:TerB family tellurite resistance protein [Leptospiraceae bacterium]MCP5501847.1 TerB family tellurite resistance protein [Leptospiraceae bacterium]
MKLFSKFKAFFDRASVRFWKEDEKRALLKLVHEVYNADSNFSDIEKEEFRKQLEDFSLEPNSVIFFNFENAVNLLKEDDDKKKVTMEWLIEAVFCDGDYTGNEEEFVKRVLKAFELPDEFLEKNIKKYKS